MPPALAAAHSAPLSLTICGYGDPGLWDSRAFSFLLFLLSTHCQRAGCQDQAAGGEQQLPGLFAGDKDCARCLEYDSEHSLSLGPQEEADNAGSDETMDSVL